VTWQPLGDSERHRLAEYERAHRKQNDQRYRESRERHRRG